jgi:hypothetical protein
MSLNLKSFTYLLGSLFFCWGAATAAELEMTRELNVISDELMSIEQQKKEVAAQFQLNSIDCWKEFAVNDCLIKAKRLKYQVLAPLDQRELGLNAKRRELKEILRLQRLSDKSGEPTQRSAPDDAAQEKTLPIKNKATP